MVRFESIRRLASRSRVAQAALTMSALIFGSACAKTEDASTAGAAPPATKDASSAEVAPAASATASATAAASSQAAPKRTREQIIGEMVEIPTGGFRMGSEIGASDERPTEFLSVKGFAIDKTEVTVAAYRLCVDEGGCTRPKPTSWPRIKGVKDATVNQCNYEKKGREQHPINCVDYKQARAYCKWAGKRLAAEHEWEYAARGKDKRIFTWGKGKLGARRANVRGREFVAAFKSKGLTDMATAHQEDDGWPETAPVGSFAEGASPFGLLDMAGNVWEWTMSAYCPYDDRFCKDKRKVIRGGSWFDKNPSLFRAAKRSADLRTGRGANLGLRCAKDLK